MRAQVTLRGEGESMRSESKEQGPASGVGFVTHKAGDGAEGTALQANRSFSASTSSRTKLKLCAAAR